MHVRKEYNIIMYASDNFFYACDKHAAMYEQIFAMYASDTRFYAWINVCHASKFTIFFFFCLWTNVCLLLWKNVCHVIKMLIQYLATNCLSCSTNSIFEVVTYS
jgi:hypothetical protein